MAVEAAGYEAAAVGGEGQRRHSLLVIGDHVLGLGGDEVEHGDLVLGGGEHGGAGGQGQHVLDGGGVLEGHDGGARGPRVPQPHRGVVAAGDQHVGHGARHEAAAAHVIGMADEVGGAILARQVPQAHGLVVARAHQGGEVGGGELGGPHGLAVGGRPGFQDGARRDVEDLDLARVIAGHDDPPIAAHVAAPGDIAKSRDGLDELSRPDGVDLYAGAGGDGEVIIAGGGADIGRVY